MLTLATKARGQDGPPGSLLRCCGSPLTHHTYCLPGAWTDESTFVVTVLDASGSEVALGETVVMARHAPSTAAAIAHRPIRFKGGVSAQANSTSPSPHL